METYVFFSIWTKGHYNYDYSYSAGIVFVHQKLTSTDVRAGILVQVTINRRLLIGRDGHLDQSEAYDLS